MILILYRINAGSKKYYKLKLLTGIFVKRAGLRVRVYWS